MFGFRPNPAAAYAKVGLETGVASADPHRLVLMLYDGALLTISRAEQALANSDIPGKGQATSKAIEIIENGLKASLDYNVGGDLAIRLGALYDYMVTRLLHGNLHNQAAAFAEVHGLLSELREAWAEIGERQVQRDVPADTLAQ